MRLAIVALAMSACATGSLPPPGFGTCIESRRRHKNSPAYFVDGQPIGAAALALELEERPESRREARAASGMIEGGWALAALAGAAYAGGTGLVLQDAMRPAAQQDSRQTGAGLGMALLGLTLMVPSAILESAGHAHLKRAIEQYDGGHCP
jgi:hypothetical protein